MDSSLETIICIRNSKAFSYKMITVVKAAGACGCRLRPVPGLKVLELYLRSPMRLHGAVLRYRDILYPVSKTWIWTISLLANGYRE